MVLEMEVEMKVKKTPEKVKEKVKGESLPQWGDMPGVLDGRTYKYKLGCGSAHIIVNRAGGRILEVYCITGKSGGCSLSFTQALGKMVSTALQRGVEPEEVIRMLSGISCNNGAWNEGVRVDSCSDAIAHAIRADLREDLATGRDADSEGQGQGTEAHVREHVRAVERHEEALERGERQADEAEEEMAYREMEREKAERESLELR